MIDWHRLFGLGLTDYFTDSCYQVEMEKDLSIKQQLLDVLIIEQRSGNEISDSPPDGLENLAPHNLMTYKSLRQPLDDWAMDELIGHYVNYRKQSSSSWEALLPAEDFGLYAVSTRHPDKLEAQTMLEPVKKGVYDVHWGSRQVRLIVLSEVAKVERNALWLMFSGIMDNVQYGASLYNWRQYVLSTIMKSLFKFYRIEGVTMSYTVEDYKRELREEWLASLTPEKLLEVLSPEELLKRLPAEELLEVLSPEQLLKKLPAEELLKRLTREDIEAYLKKLSTSN